MPAKLTNIFVYRAFGYGTDVADQISVGGSHDLFLHLAEMPTYTEKQGELRRVEIKLGTGSAWKMTRAITSRMRIVLTYDDASEKYYRAQFVEATTGGAHDLLIRAESIVGDLAYSTFERTRKPLTYPNRVLPLRNITLDSALTILFDAKNGVPAFFAKGTVHADILSLRVNFDGNYSTHQEILRNLMEQAAEKTATGHCEFEERISAGTLFLDFYEEAGWSAAERTAGTPDPDSRRLDPPDPGLFSNRQTLKIEERSDDYFSRILPLAGDTGEDRVGIRDLYFKVKTGGTGAGGTTQFVFDNDVSDGPFYLDTVYEGYSAYFPDDTINEVLTTDTDGNIEISGERTVVAGDWVKFVEVKAGLKTTATPDVDSDLAEVDYVYNPAAEASLGAAHARDRSTEEFPNVSPYANIFADTEFQADDLSLSPGSADMSDWVDGDSHPSGISNVGGTLAKETDGAYVEYGSAAARFSGGAGDILRTDRMFIDTDLPVVDRYVSAWVAARMLSGSARLTIRSATTSPVTTVIFPPSYEEQAELVPDETLALALGGAEIGADLPDDGFWVSIELLEAASVLILDALVFTNTLGAWAYKPDMGPLALYLAAAARLKKDGGKIRRSYEAEFFDQSVFDPASGQNEVVLGSHSRLRDFSDGAGGWLVDITGRVVEVSGRDDHSIGRLRKTVRLEE